MIDQIDTNGARPLAPIRTWGNQKRASDEVCVPVNKKVPYPALCLRCAGMRIQDDSGEMFSCGMMVEAMSAGVPVVSCSHFARSILSRTVHDTPENESLLRGFL